MFLNAYPQGLCKKNADTSEMDEGKEVACELVVANGDSAELLEFEEELFHKMTFLVKPPIDVPRISITIPGRDAEVCIMIVNKLSKRPLAVGLISEGGRSFQGDTTEQFFSNGNIVNIAGSQHDLDRVAQGVHNGVNLGASPGSSSFPMDLQQSFFAPFMRIQAYMKARK